MLVDVVAERLVEQAVELAVVAEHHVSALVPGEAGGIDLRPGVPAGYRRALVDRPVLVAEAGELVTAGEAAGAGPDHGDVRRLSAPHPALILGTF